MREQLIVTLLALIQLCWCQSLPPIQNKTITLPAPLKRGIDAWRLWVMRNMYVYPLYLVPLDNGQSLIGWTDSSNTGHVSLLDEDESNLIWTRNFSEIVRGVTTKTGVSDGSFAVLLWNETAATIHLAFISGENEVVWDTNSIVITQPWPSTPTNFKIGDSRVAHGKIGFFSIYYHVHSFDGHEGDALYYFNDTTGIKRPNTGWGWGCSHSMNSLLDFHPTSQKSMALCVSDCYSDKAILVFNGRYTIQKINANCAGGAAAELGGMVAGFDTWGVAFTSQTDTQLSDGPPKQVEVGYMVLDGTTGKPLQNNVTWLTSPSGKAWKADASLARWGPFPTSNESDHRVLVGWATDPLGANVTTEWYGTSKNMKYSVAVLNGKTGEFIEGPYDVTDSTSWGCRDDSFKTTSDGSVMWVHGRPNSNILRIGKFKYKI
ncbi:hypothetical protein BC833DRAFT_580267, partial [Globomyces pollinis-pini]